MLKKSITYTDFNGDEVTEDHYFHLSKADLVEMEMSQKGGMHEYLTQIVKSEDGKAIISVFKELILSAYGERSEDGKRFIKSPVLREEFATSEAYSALFMELCTNADSAAEFVNGIVPAGLDEDIKKLTAETPTPNGPVATLLTPAQVREMEPDELKSGLATGRYKLAP